MTPQERAALLVHPNIANVRQYRGTGSLDMARIHAVTRWVGNQLEADRLARIAGRGTVRLCGRLGCDRPAAYAIKSPYDLPVFRCSAHAPETYEAHAFFSNRQSTGTRMEALS